MCPGCKILKGTHTYMLTQSLQEPESEQLACLPLVPALISSTQLSAWHKSGV